MMRLFEFIIEAAHQIHTHTYLTHIYNIYKDRHSGRFRRNYDEKSLYKVHKLSVSRILFCYLLL